MALCVYESANTNIRNDGLTCQYYLLSPEEYTQLTDMLSKTYVESSTLEMVLGFDPAWFAVGFGGVLLLFASGLGVGFVVQQIRLLRRP